MKVDKFTKVVLAIIALNLTILTLRNLDLIPKANASEPTNNTVLSPNMNYGLVPLNEDGSINVKLSEGDPIDVRIVGIEAASQQGISADYWDAINVKIK